MLTGVDIGRFEGEAGDDKRDEYEQGRATGQTENNEWDLTRTLGELWDLKDQRSVVEIKDQCRTLALIRSRMQTAVATAWKKYF